MSSDKLSESKSRTQPTGGASSPGLARLLPTALPLALLVMALVLPYQMFESDQKPSEVGLGPAAWPDAMLIGLGIFSALWIIRDFWVLGAAGRQPTLNIPVEDEHYHFGKALVGLALIVAYGWLLPKLGFAISTSAFIAIWCLLGGLRNPVVVVPVTLIGTVGLMWLFMGLALMPLPRGMGIFDNFSIWLLRATGIY